MPYRSAIEFYHRELHFFTDFHVKQRRCACGCGVPVFDPQEMGVGGMSQKNAKRKHHGLAFCLFVTI
jgi:hypothetical protein